MWTVIEMPLSAPGLVSIDGTMLRHLQEEGEDATACGMPADSGRRVRIAWAKATMRCGGCDQTQAIGL